MYPELHCERHRSRGEERGEKHDCWSNRVGSQPPHGSDDDRDGTSDPRGAQRADMPRVRGERFARVVSAKDRAGLSMSRADPVGPGSDDEAAEDDSGRRDTQNRDAMAAML